MVEQHKCLFVKTAGFQPSTTGAQNDLFPLANIVKGAAAERPELTRFDVRIWSDYRPKRAHRLELQLELRCGENFPPGLTLTPPSPYDFL